MDFAPGYLSPQEQQIWNVTFATVWSMNGGYRASVAKDAADKSIDDFRKLKSKDDAVGTYVSIKEKT